MLVSLLHHACSYFKENLGSPESNNHVFWQSQAADVIYSLTVKEIKRNNAVLKKLSKTDRNLRWSKDVLWDSGPRLSPYSGHNDCPLHFVYYIKETQNHRILGPEITIHKTHILVGYVCLIRISKDVLFFQKHSFGTKFHWQLWWLQKEPSLANCPNLQPISVRVGYNFKTLWKLIIM